MTVLLNDDEIRDKRILGYNNQMTDEAIECLLKVVAKTQLKAVAEWGEKTCTEHLDNDGNPPGRRLRCLHCWEALFKEVE